VFRAFRQALSWAAARSLTTRDASAGIKNPKRKRHERREVTLFETWAEVEAVADELDPRYRAIPIIGVGTGLRPEELFGLHRSDVDRQAGVLHVRRRFTGGMVKEGGKTDASVRTVPLRQRVVDALDALAPRIDTPILFPAPRGGYIDGERSGTANGHRRCGLPVLSIAASTICGTRSRRGRLRRAASTSGSSRRSWGRASRSSRTLMRAG
jgi:integrase